MIFIDLMKQMIYFDILREGFIESRIRVLIQYVESYPAVKLAHPYPEFFFGDRSKSQFPKNSPESLRTSSFFYIGIVLEKKEIFGQSFVDLSGPVQNFEDLVKNWTDRKESMNIDAMLIKRFVVFSLS
jgi:poly(A) polymerase Pap1